MRACIVRALLEFGNFEKLCIRKKERGMGNDALVCMHTFFANLDS